MILIFLFPGIIRTKTLYYNESGSTLAVTPSKGDWKWRKIMFYM